MDKPFRKKPLDKIKAFTCPFRKITPQRSCITRNSLLLYIVEIFYLLKVCLTCISKILARSKGMRKTMKMEYFKL